MVYFIILIILVYIIIRYSSKNKKQKSGKHASNSASTKAPLPDILQFGKHKFYISNAGYIKEHEGPASIYELELPEGITGIGSDMVFPVTDTLILPKSLLFIGDSSLPFVCTVFYRGSEADWSKVRIGDGNFRNFERVLKEGLPPYEEHTSFHFNFKS